MDYLTKFICIAVSMIIVISSAAQAYSYDSATTCDPRTSRRGRAQLIATIPCDLSVQAYCNLPGKAYPWHAVRRFVHENQGLMRRMYGDVRHISILRTEIDNNDIEIEDIETAARRYSGDRRQRQGRVLNQNNLKQRSNDVITEPHFRPTSTQRTTTTTTVESTTESTTINTSTTSSSASPLPSSSSTSTTPRSTTTTDRTTSTTKSSFETDVDLEDENNSLNNNILDMALQELIDANIESNSVFGNVTEMKTGSIKKQLQPHDNIKVVEPPNLMAMNDSMKTPTATISTTLKLFNIDKTQEMSSTIKKNDSTLPMNVQQQAQDKIDEVRDEDKDDEEDDSDIVEIDDEDDDESAEDISAEHENVIEDNIPTSSHTSTVKITPSTKNKVGMEGQLFQDVVQKDSPATVNMRGINACPVKEEVVAPFWANNTRGEVLALLNLYPFEQYVHWEKCTHEHKQMYCREGCRCEQQYRLHRLLAYDPHNECRGIFSDWFRFPSCCICKCYDIPFDFRVTSRSPRSAETKHPLEYIEDEVQKAIYDHAADEWYRPKEYDID